TSDLRMPDDPPGIRKSRWNDLRDSTFLKRRFNALGRKRDLAEASAGRIVDRVRDGGGNWSRHRLADALRGWVRAAGHEDVDRRDFGEGEDRIGRPVMGCDDGGVERDLLLHRPTHGLDD